MIYIYMRYYPCKLNLDNFHHTLSGCIQTIYTDSLLLTKHGFYKYIGDELYKYKISMDKKEDIVLKKYIQNIDFIINRNQWIKKDKEFRLPTESVVVYLETHVFLLSSKSKTKFIIEKLEDNILDYYFTSKENPDHHSLKEDIASFLSLLN